MLRDSLMDVFHISISIVSNT